MATSKIDKLPVIGITMGDPAGIGPEIIVKALSSKAVSGRYSPLVIGDLKTMQKTAAALNIAFDPVCISNPDEITPDGSCHMIDMDNVDENLLRPGKPYKGMGHAVMEYIKLAAELALTRQIDAVTTCPINKAVIKEAGSMFPGHTEMFADITKTKTFAMMMAGGGLRIVLATIHIPLSEVPSVLTRQKVTSTIETAYNSITELYNISRPKIAVAGLNPHAGEEGAFGSEEKETIIPAIEDARKSLDATGNQISGPIPADTLFFRTRSGEFDAAVVMYHDQGLGPLKTVAFNSSVNITIGLPIIRTSVDHGTAYNIAGMAKASEQSLQEALSFACDFALIKRSSKNEA